MAMAIEVSCELTALKSDQPTRHGVRQRESPLECPSEIERVEKGKHPGVGRGEDQGPSDLEDAPNLRNSSNVGAGVLHDLEHYDGVERTVRKGEALDIAANNPDMGVPTFGRCQGRRVEVEPEHRFRPSEKVAGQISARASNFEQTPSARQPGARQVGLSRAELLEYLLPDYPGRHCESSPQETDTLVVVRVGDLHERQRVARHLFSVNLTLPRPLRRHQDTLP